MKNKKAPRDEKSPCPEQVSILMRTECCPPPPPWWKQGSRIELPQEADLCSLGWFHIGCSVLVSAIGSLDTQQWLCYIGLGKGKSMFLVPCLTSHPCWSGHLVSPLGNDRSGWGQRLMDPHKIGHLIQRIKILYRGCLWSVFTQDENNIYSLFPLREL